jgi:hypothetical protein
VPLLRCLFTVRCLFTAPLRPDSDSIADIPSCHEDIYIGNKACMEIAYSPNNTIANQIMGNVTARNSKSITVCVTATILGM